MSQMIFYYFSSCKVHMNRYCGGVGFVCMCVCVCVQTLSRCYQNAAFRGNFSRERSYLCLNRQEGLQAGESERLGLKEKSLQSSSSN